MFPMPNAEHAQEDAALRLRLDQLDEFLFVLDADVEVAIGRQDDAVGAVFDEMLGGHVVRKLNAGPAVGRAAGLQLVDGRHDVRALLHDTRSMAVPGPTPRRRQPWRRGHSRRVVRPISASPT